MVKVPLIIWLDENSMVFSPTADGPEIVTSLNTLEPVIVFGELKILVLVKERLLYINPPPSNVKLFAVHTIVELPLLKVNPVVVEKFQTVSP